ncbi:hypothetical protein LRY60_01025 [Candidatus Woesebacteria bacterium]|nr:hypothetical protein [Candidatus Woesebacteria bacterium]
MSPIRKLWNLAWNSPALRQSGVAMVGTVLTGGFMAVAMILASRFLGPIDFGIFFSRYCHYDDCHQRD